ncbi:lipoate protein ligase C-terminal domain-containing protein [Enterococcus durans]
MRELEESLKGQPFLYESLKTKLNEVNISEYITHFSMEGLLDLLFGEVV